MVLQNFLNFDPDLSFCSKQLPHRSKSFFDFTVLNVWVPYGKNFKEALLFHVTFPKSKLFFLQITKG